MQICVRAVKDARDGVLETEGMEPLYNILRNNAERAGRAYLDNFPHSPKALAGWLAQSATLLGAVGIESTKRKVTGTRYYGLRSLAVAPPGVEVEQARLL